MPCHNSTLLNNEVRGIWLRSTSGVVWGVHRFISTGLYKYCRYPNYSGEILVWTGLTVVAGTGGVLLKQPWVVLSPTFIAALLLFVSGVLAPLLLSVKFSSELLLAGG